MLCRREKKQMKKIITKITGWIKNWLLAALGGLLVGMATIHRLQLNLDSPEPYTSNPLIPLEIILLIGVIVLLLVKGLEAIYLLFKRQWKDLAIVAVNFVIGVSCMYGAMWIDSPTLIYMT
jgi:hypothetical protein